MVNIYLCGPAGSGKHNLIQEILSQCNRQTRSHVKLIHTARNVLRRHGIKTRTDYKCNDKLFEEIQREIIMTQCNAENDNENCQIICDFCIVNTLALLSECLDGAHTVNNILIENKELIDRSLQRYKLSLVILLGPYNYSYDDNICLKLTEKDWTEMKQTYVQFFHQLHIPFIDVNCMNIEDRLAVVQDALSGKQKLETSTLSFYDPKSIPKNCKMHNSFSFFKQVPIRDNCVFIPTIKVTEHSYEQIWTEISQGLTNRFIDQNGMENLICIEFDINVRSTVVHKMLLNGILCNGETYSFLGCSSNGLKNRKCYMLKGSSNDVNELLMKSGEFNELKTVPKRLARIGLLFTAVKLTNVFVDDNNIENEKDIIVGKHNFSDGCGGVSPELAREIFEQVREEGIEIAYTPSVFQVRFQGCKGVLALNNKLTGKKILVRPSMKKFNTNAYHFIGVCEYSKPYTLGHLNKQFIILLSGLGIDNKIFLEKQRKHLQMLSKMLSHPDVAIEMLQWQNKFSLAQKINRAGSIGKLAEDEKVIVTKQLKAIQEKMIAKLEKLSILIPESRNIFGVCDTSGLLNYGQCFLRLTISGRARTIRGQVVVCKNPCYLLGDVRVLTAIDETDNPAIQELHHLIDCIVFPSRGKRPHSVEIAGSDLDGDQYFVTWDKDLVPKNTREPYDYPPAETKSQGNITEEKIIAYFSKQNETQKLIGTVDKYFHKWANIKGASSTECERLGQLFSRVIDAGKSGEGEEITIPDGLKKIPNQTEITDIDAEQKYVWIKMESIAIKFKEKETENILEISDKNGDLDISREFIDDFAKKKYSNISEFDKFKFLFAFVRRTNQIAEKETVDEFMTTFGEFVNFSAFTILERKEAVDIGIPYKYIANALNRSKFLSANDLHYFYMDSPLNTWNSYLALNHEQFDWSHLVKTLTTNDHVLLVFKLPDDVIIEVQFEEKLNTGLEQPVKSGVISSILYSKHFGYKDRYVLGKGYVVDLTEDTLQLYRERQKNLTFIWLKATDRKLVKGQWNKRVCEEVTNSVSVDLQRFNRRILQEDRRHPLINKLPFVGVEIYAQNIDRNIPYWDIYDANDILPISEEVENETETDEDFQIDESKLLPCLDREEIPSSEEELTNLLQDAAEHNNLSKFKQLLKYWHEMPLPKTAVHTLSTLLEHIVKKIFPLTPSDEVINNVIEITTMMSILLTEPVVILKVSSLLGRLGTDDVKSQILARDLNVLSVSEFINILEQWHEIWFLDARSAVAFLAKLFRGMLRWEHQLADETFLKIEKYKYIRHYGCLHILSMIQEFNVHEEKYENTSVQSQSCIMYLKVDRTAKTEPSAISFYRTGALEQRTYITKGQFVAISRQRDAKKNCSFKTKCFIGQVQTLQPAPFTVTVNIIGCVPEVVLASLRPDVLRYWKMNLIGNIATYERVVKAFKILADETKIIPLTPYIIHPRGFVEDISKEDVYPEILEIDTEDLEQSKYAHLNENQLIAVKKALQSNICLIQGPPGTGKTEVACQIVTHLVAKKKYEHSILVVAETNVAVDNLARRLKKDMFVVRIGSVDGISNDLYDISLEGQIRIIAEKEAKKTKIRDTQGDIHTNTKLMTRVLKSADVVLSTCAGVGDCNLDNYKFQFVLVDEATQTMETTMLCSIVHEAEHIIMIGDPKQLGPVVNEQSSLEYENILPNVTDLSQTLFHRFFKTGVVPCCFLDVQHRMHPAIMHFPSMEFYSSKLKAASAVSKRTPIKFPWPFESRPICFINVNGKETRRGTSYCNMEEVDYVQKAVKVLLDLDEEIQRDFGIDVNNIGILTMYQGQVQELKNKIQCNVAISSVDGFQGQEKDVIIVSTVRSNKHGSVGFSGDERRINVLLTRAKRGLIIIGNQDTLQHSKIWDRWLEHAPKLDINNLTSETKEIVKTVKKKK